MDGLKLDRWRRSFEERVKYLQVEYDAFLLQRKFSDIYKLKVDPASHTLTLWVDSSNVPEEIQKRLTELLLETEPEDSV